MRRYGEPCKDQEPLLPLEFCSDCIIATRGYDFWEGQACSGFTRITARQIAQPPRGDLCHEAPTPAVARMSRSSATGSIDNSPGGFFLH